MIDIKNVTKVFKEGTHALYDVSLHVDDSEFIYITGPTGAGKTTLIRLLDGEEIPTKGKVIVSGVDVGHLRKSRVPLYRRNIGVVFQDYKILPRKNVFENIAFALEVVDKTDEEIRKRVREVLKLVDLEDKQKAYIHQLSGGQKQRVAIARAIANKPKVLIADEPTGNLDAVKTDDIISLFEKINEEEKTTIIIVTHDEEVLRNHPKRTIRIESGHVVDDKVINENN